jgi:isopentenyl diphosphate isomerase/L-lactate dehydrogenase-like FMN-dependent dehydrogenase
LANMLTGLRFKWSSRLDPITVEDYRQAARRSVPDLMWGYIDGGADDLFTLRANRSAFAQWCFRPKVLTGREGTELSTNLGGATLSLPVFLAPTGMSAIAHWTGEIAAAQAAERAGTRAVISTAASYSPEEIARATQENHFFQLYPWANLATGARTLTESFIRRAQEAGYQGLFVTVDVPVHGNREAERKRGLGVPPLLTPRKLLGVALKPRWLANYLRHQRNMPPLLADAMKPEPSQLRIMRPELSWDDFKWIRDVWKGPLYIKGVLHPDDAMQAVELGADGVLVSNHGGRQLDSTQATLDALPAIVERLNGRVPVLLDGGVRRGSDVVKALCLGATAVGIGRPYLYGLAARGGAGVEHVLEIFREEISRTLTLLGCKSIDELDRSMLVPADPVRVLESGLS